MRNLTIGRIWGIPIRLNISLLVFLPILAWLLGSGTQIGVYADTINALWPGSLDSETFQVGARSWTIGILGALGLFVSVAIHELGHSWAARRYGIEVKSITLWLLGGLASFAEMPKEWQREFWIALAGPVTSVLLAGVFAGLLQLAPASLPVVVFTLGFLAIVNVVLAIFNMLPAFPMDGGRVLRALLARNRPYGSATRIAARVGSIFAMLFVVLGVLLFEIIMILVGLFIYVAATGESRTVMLEELLEGISVRSLATADAAVDVSDSAQTLLDRLLAERRTDLLVRDGDEVVGVVTASSLRAVDPADYATTRVEDLVTRDLPRLDADLGAFPAIVAMNESRAAVALVEEQGRVVGAISRSDFAAAMELRRGTSPA
jgi:Zn-dependent protease